MIEELRAASERFCVALEQYVHACSTIQRAFPQGVTLRNTPSDWAARLDQELGQFGSYGTQLQQAELAIKLTRNYTFDIVPINRLPAEILARIFQMVRDINPHRVDTLAQICSRWRAIAISSCSLWTRIDYRPHPGKRFRPGMLARARLHALRSGRIPLDFCVSAVSEVCIEGCDDSPVEELCELVAPRMQCLAIDLRGYHGEVYYDSDHSIISGALSSCIPGTLTKLVTRDLESFRFFTYKGDMVSSSSQVEVSLNSIELDSVFAPITVMHLTGLFPSWESPAYHGLVDLRLHAAVGLMNGGGEISESCLTSILASSPGLRVFHFGLKISDQIEGDVSGLRVHLPNLEELYVSSGAHYFNYFTQIGDLFRLLSPTPRPLRLSIQDHASEIREPLTADIRAFLTGSNVTSFYIKQFPRPFDLVCSGPPIRVLALSECKVWGRLELFNSPDPSVTTTYPRLDACILIDSLVPLDELRIMVQMCRVQTITIFGCSFYCSNSRNEVDVGTVKKDLSAICPNVVLAETYPNLEYQDLLDPERVQML